MKDKSYTTMGMISNTGGGLGTTTISSEIDRLVREKEDLLRNGYTPDDPLIMEYDR